VKSSLTVVVEGKTDALIIKHLLLPTISNLRFFAANGTLSTVSVARNILVHDAANVLIVADADTRDIHRAKEDMATMRLALRNVAPDQAFDVFLFLPQIESVFFETPSPLASLKLTQPWQRHEPKSALATLCKGQDVESWTSELTNEEWHTIREGVQAAKLIKVANDLVKRSFSDVYAQVSAP
jgi:hypothetical protein